MSLTPTLAEVITEAIEARLAQVHVALPGKIESYDASEQKASIKPLVKFTQVLDDGDVIDDLPIINDVPVVFPRGGGHFISFPLAKGDFVLLIVCESSIEKFSTGDGSNQDPIDARRHDLSDAVALPGFYPFSSAIDGGTDADGSQFGKEGGAIVHISDDEVNLYEKAAADFVALAADVKSELDLFKTDLDNLKTLLTTHVHPGVTVGAGATGTSPAFGAYTPHTPGEVAATKVKAT